MVPGINPSVCGLWENVLIWSRSKPQMLSENSYPSINISANQRSYQRLPADRAISEEKECPAPWGVSRYYLCICSQKAGEVKLWERITLDLEFSRQLRKSLQIPRREERIKGLFSEVLISKRRPDAVLGTRELEVIQRHWAAQKQVSHPTRSIWISPRSSSSCAQTLGLVWLFPLLVFPIEVTLYTLLWWWHWSALSWLVLTC